MAGAPDIGDSIYEKIDSADIFIADVTIINGDYAGRKTPNPNVMIELGYAIKSLGWDRIILLYDKDFGEIEELPFDINHRRITCFTVESCEEKARMRDYVLSCITATIQILEQEHRLYGGFAETVKAQSALGQLIRTGLNRIWAAYVEHKRVDEFDLYDKIPPISEAQLAEYMRGNKFDSPEVAALSMEVLKFVSDLDVLNNNMLEKTLKMDA